MNTSQPTLFVPHGTPTFAIRPGAAGAALQRIARTLPRPRALIVISPHWDTPHPVVGTAGRFETIHDFWGFPQALYQIRYPATGCPEGAEEVAEAIEVGGFRVTRDTARGLDHGAWVPLRLMYPDADVPIIPLSLQSRGGAELAYRLGQALAPLVERGFMIMGTGSVTHNLRDFQTAWHGGGQTPGYVQSFADWIARRVAEKDVVALLGYRKNAPFASRAHPTDEHLLPLLTAFGAAGKNAKAERLHAGIDDYVIAMDAYAFWPN